MGVACSRVVDVARLAVAQSTSLAVMQSTSLASPLRDRPRCRADDVARAEQPTTLDQRRLL